LCEKSVYVNPYSSVPRNDTNSKDARERHLILARAVTSIRNRRIHQPAIVFRILIGGVSLFRLN